MKAKSRKRRDQYEGYRVFRGKRKGRWKTRPRGRKGCLLQQARMLWSWGNGGSRDGWPDSLREPVWTWAGYAQHTSGSAYYKPWKIEISLCEKGCLKILTRLWFCNIFVHGRILLAALSVAGHYQWEQRSISSPPVFLTGEEDCSTCLGIADNSFPLFSFNPNMFECLRSTDVSFSIIRCSTSKTALPFNMSCLYCSRPQSYSDAAVESTRNFRVYVLWAINFWVVLFAVEPGFPEQGDARQRPGACVMPLEPCNRKRFHSITGEDVIWRTSESFEHLAVLESPNIWQWGANIGSRNKIRAR